MSSGITLQGRVLHSCHSPSFNSTYLRKPFGEQTMAIDFNELTVLVSVMKKVISLLKVLGKSVGKW